MRTSIITLAFIGLFLIVPHAFAFGETSGHVAQVSGHLAQGGTNPGVSLENPLQGQGDLPSFLSSILAFVVRIGAIVVVVMLVFVGFKFVTAQGNESELTKAKSMLLWTLIGGLVLLGAQAISLGIQATVNALSTGG